MSTTVTLFCSGSALRIMVSRLAGSGVLSSSLKYSFAITFVPSNLVTAVDQQLNVFARAAQGPHIEIAAPGVNVLIARDQAYASLSGTSLAAVMITAVLASEKALPNKPDLSLRAKQIGDTVRDNIYGFGLMQK